MHDTLARRKVSRNKKEIDMVKEALGEVEKILVITQAEYDALPETKNTDGVLYLIKE